MDATHTPHNPGTSQRKGANQRHWPGVILAVMMTIFGVLVASAIPAFARNSPSSEVSPQANLANEPCVPEDPFELARLAQEISKDTPSSAPVIINRFLTVEFIGQGNLIDDIPEEIPESPDEGDPQPEPEEPPPEEVVQRDLKFRVFNTRTLFEYELTLNGSMLTQIHQCREDAGLTLASEGVDDLSTVEIPRLFLPLLQTSGAVTATTTTRTHTIAPNALSNAHDSRFLLGGTTAWPWRAISQFRYGSGQDSGCTGTLVGPRHLVTAAHCINKIGTNNWFNFWVTPGKNGEGSSTANEPFGRSFIQLNPPPGTEAWYFTHSPWRNPNTSNPRQWDWGMIVIPDKLGNQTGWMGYVARPASQLNVVNHLNRGYPQCLNNRNDNPAACTAATPNLAHLHGDTKNCTIGSYSAQGPDNWNRLITHSCDTSAGHSGSPVYHYFFDTTLNKWVPVVAMVHVASQCQACTPSDNHPSVSRRQTPTELNVISFFREVFP